MFTLIIATVTVENFMPDAEDDTQPITIEVRGLVTGPSAIKMEDYNSFGDASFGKKIIYL